jgi:AAA domain
MKMTMAQQTPPADYYAPAVQGLSFLIHGPAKAGKSSLAATTPAPRVILDAESGSAWVPGRTIWWDPLRQPPPPLGRHLTAGYGQPSITPDWESARVRVHDAQVVISTYQILASGRHPFNGLSMDSLTEVQQRLIDSRTGARQMELKDWGYLLRQVTHMTRQFRDLITNPVKPLWGICFIAGTEFDKAMGKWRPLLQGASQQFVPYFVDVLGYLGATPDGTRQLLIGPHPQYETGERVGGRLPYSFPVSYGRYPGLNIETAIRQVLAGGNAA